MSLRRQYTMSAAAGRSLKTARQPWVGYAPTAVTTSVSSLVNVSATSPNTKTAWTQLFSAAQNTSDTGMMLLYTPLTIYAGNNGALYDIGIGASGSETVIASNIGCGGYEANGSQPAIMLPVFIPSGTRVAYRGQVAASGSQTLYAVAFLMRTDFMEVLPRSLDVIGTSTATSRATALSGASGTYTQITGATSRAYQSVILYPSAGSKTGISANFRLTLAIGPPGSEVDLCSCEANQQGGGTFAVSNSFCSIVSLPAGRYIPAGSRLSVKHNIAANPDRVECCVIGVPYG